MRGDELQRGVEQPRSPLGPALVRAASRVSPPAHALFARMRREAPVRWNPSPAEGHAGFWSLTRHAEVSEVSKDPERFSSYENGIFLQPDQVVPLELTRNLLLYMDPPQHTKYPKILQTAFTPRTVSALEDQVRARIARVVAEAVARGDCDFVGDVAVPIPLGVLAELMGIPDADIPRLYGWTEDIEAATRAPEPNAAMEAFGEMAGYLNEQIAAQAERGDDESLVMRLRAAEVDGEQLTDPEILVFFGLLVFAGNDTTRNTAAAGMKVLLEHPDQLAALREDPSLIPGAVEEILRWTSVVNYFVRTVTADTELAGQPIARGERLVMWYTSASRDEAVFEDPQRFDIRRPTPEHKAFGGGGRHFCLGAGLARLELRVLLEELVGRAGQIEATGPAGYLPSHWAHMVSSLPVRFTDKETTS